MVSDKVKNCEVALRELLLSEFPDTYFSVNGYQEDSVCMETVKDGWQVYIGNRNNKDQLSTFSNIMEASFDMIRKLCCNEDKANNLINTFLEAILAEKTA